jgi:hypothetical protein
VALDQRVDRAPLLRDIDLALGRNGLTAIASPAATRPGARAATTTATTAPVAAPGVSSGRPPPGPGGAQPGSPPASVLPPRVQPVEPIVDAVDDLLRGLP